MRFRPIRAVVVCSALSCLSLLAVAPRLAAGTNSWSPIGPAGATVTALAVSPASPSTIVAGTPTGFSVTMNGGTAWSTFSTGYETSVIAFDPSNASIVYAGTGGALGRSADAGATYVPVILEPTNSLAIDPASPATLYAGTVDHIYKSTDRGLTWSPVYTGPGHSFVNALAVDPGNSQVVWAAMTFGGVKKSTNGGATWTSVPGSIPMGSAPAGVVAIAVHPARSNTVLMLGSDGVYRSTDGGTSWSQVKHLSSWNGDLVADRTTAGTFYASGSDGVAFSADGGATWNPLDSGLTNTDVQALAIDPADHTRVYAGTAGSGVFAMTVDSGGAPTLRVTSPNGGEVWQAGSTQRITWTASASIASVNLEYSTTSLWDGQLVDPQPIVTSTPNTGSYQWVVPQSMSPVCHVRVSDAAGTTSDISDGAFQIVMCGFTGLTPPFSQSFAAAGGRATIQVTPSSGCSWTAVSEDPWIVVTSGWSGSGSGSLTYSVAPNLDSSPRSGTLRIGTATFRVDQSGGTPSTEGVVFVPIVLDVFGVAPSHYTSELTLTNRSDRDASLRLTYTGASTLGGGSGSAALTLPAGHQIIEPDALAFLARLGATIPASGNRGGTLSVGISGVPSLSDVAVTVRTTTAVANGQAGLAYGGTPAWKTLTSAAYVCGLRENASDRSNLALQNAGSPADGSVTLRVTVFSGDSSARVVRADETLPPGGFTQVGGILGLHGMTNGYVKVERVGGTAPWYAYGVVNDQANSDGSFIPPQLATTAPVAGLTVPVVIEAGVYTSELVATNWSTRSRELQLLFFADNVGTPGRGTAVSLSLEAGRQVILPNVFQHFRDHAAPGIGPAGSGYVGALFVSSPADDLTGIVVGARTSSPGGGGRYGLFYPATPSGGAATGTAWLYGLQQNATNRTNLALVHTGEAGEDDVFAIDVFDGATGQLVHTEEGLTVKAFRWTQENTLLSRWAPGVPHGYARVRRTSGTSAFLAYAVINDGGVPQQRSDDGAFLPASD
ncbi:MAG: hypothetical protein IPP07_28540 [Holophagales bacterium]|nr:hypothetical protein [Holophagales bacterium]